MPHRFRRLVVVASALVAFLGLASCGGDGGAGVEPPRAPQVTTDSVPTGAVGIPYHLRLEAVEGDGEYLWAVVGGTLPAGLVLDPQTGSLSGTPTAGGDARFTVQVTSAGLTGTRSLPLTVVPALAVATAELPGGVAGVPYAITFGIDGGDGRPTFGIVSGALPTGLALDSLSGALEGVPTRTGISHFTLRVWNGMGQAAERAYTLAVHTPLRITTDSLPPAEIGTSYQRVLTASGGAGGTVWSLDSGALPEGLALSSDGRIGGVPTLATTAHFTVRAESGDGQSDTTTLTLEARHPPTRLEHEVLPDARVATTYSRALTARGGDGQYHFEVDGGVLPPGLALSDEGVIHGVPTHAGRADFRVRVTSAGDSDTAIFTLRVAPAPTDPPPVPAECLLPSPAPGFDIHLCFATPPSPTVQAAFAGAAARWGSLIVGDLPSAAPNPDAATACLAGRVLPQLRGVIDDVVIHVVIEPIDGEGGVLGAAGPCFVRNSNLLPTIGIMILDSADVDRMAAQGHLGEVIVHEMGHVLGIGTLWEYMGLLHEPAVAGVTDPLLFDTFFAGWEAIDAFNALGGAVRSGNRVPVQNTGRTGSINGHWRESVLDRELMTPYLDIGVFNPLSAISVASLADLGYLVDPSGADPYVVPFPHAAHREDDAAAPERIELVDDILRLPLHIADDGGSIVRVVPHPGGG